VLVDFVQILGISGKNEAIIWPVLDLWGYARAMVWGWVFGAFVYLIPASGFLLFLRHSSP